MSYISVADVRRLFGAADPPSDADIQLAIDIQQEQLENLTRNFFESRALTLELDGDDTDVLLLNVPIISVTNLFMNDDDNAADPTTYIVYNGRQKPQDDRFNPKIAIKLFKRNIFQRVSQDRFWAGHRNQKVEGTFGFLEADDTVPKLIQYALTKMVIRNLNQDFGDDSAVLSSSGKLIKETSDGHSYELSEKAITSQSSGLTGDTEIDRIILRYRMPIIRMSSKW